MRSARLCGPTHRAQSLDKWERWPRLKRIMSQGWIGTLAHRHVRGHPPCGRDDLGAVQGQRPPGGQIVCKEPVLTIAFQAYPHPHRHRHRHRQRQRRQTIWSAGIGPCGQRAAGGLIRSTLGRFPNHQGLPAGVGAPETHDGHIAKNPLDCAKLPCSAGMPCACPGSRCLPRQPVRR